MKLAIVGTGVSGLVAAHLLHREHQLTLFESQSHIGGHTLTSDVSLDGRDFAVDAGFIVYNEENYPNFVRLLDQLGVATQPTDMSFGVKCEATGLEYAGSSLNTIFAQRRNLLSGGFLRMLRDIGRFNRDAREFLATYGAQDSRNSVTGAETDQPTTVSPGDSSGETIGDFLARGGYSRRFIDHYLIAMTSAIWSTDPATMRAAPARFLLSFLDNHGLLSTDGHFQWRVVSGGSRTYVDRITRPFRDRIRLETPVRRITRLPSGVAITTDAGDETFDEAIIATHGDQALAMLVSPGHAEREVLSAMPSQINEAVLHTDSTVLPRSRRAWAAWNYALPRHATGRVAVTYNMTTLQTLETSVPFCVSLNMSDRIDASKIIRTFRFSHPLFTADAVDAQSRHQDISGRDRIHYCGAYWRNGFHEDGVVSALAVGRAFGKTL